MAVIAGVEVSKALVRCHLATVTTLPHYAVLTVNLARHHAAPSLTASAAQRVSHGQRWIRRGPTASFCLSVGATVVCTHEEREPALLARCELVVKHRVLQRCHATLLCLRLALLTISVELLHRRNFARLFPALSAHGQPQCRSKHTVESHSTISQELYIRRKRR